MIAIAYVAISVFVLSALAKTGQLRTNRLGLATGFIFLSCSLGHFGHFMAYVTPYVATVNNTAGRVTALLFQCSLGQFGSTAVPALAGVGAPQGAATGIVYSWPLAVIDSMTAAIAVYYVTLRRHYRKLLDGPHAVVGASLFRDLTEFERERQLEKQRVEAVEAYDHKSQFLASMSHEIRTPLNGVLGMAELLRSSELDDRQQRFTQTLIESGNHLLTIVDEILDLARIESGRLELHCDDFDLRGLLARVRQLHEPGAAAKGTALHITVDPATPQVVHGDAGRLRQILSNLVSNAVKFTEDGAITVTVSPAPAEGPEVGLHFTVSDTGVGMPESALPALFDPFVQADASISGTYGGSGLGLAICRELVELMDGQISVTSKLGGGTTFALTVSVASAGATSSQPPAAGDPGAGAHHDHGQEPDRGDRQQPDRSDRQQPDRSDRQQPDGRDGRRRVLVVEDNPVNQEITVETLRWLGFNADVADDGADALDTLDGDTEYDAILMDCRMPRMDGYETTRRIRRRQDAVADLPIIAMTAMADNSDKQRCLIAGMNDFVVKPVHPGLLASVLETHGLSPDEAAVAELSRQAPAVR